MVASRVDPNGDGMTLWISLQDVAVCREAREWGQASLGSCCVLGCGGVKAS